MSLKDEYAAQDCLFKDARKGRLVQSRLVKDNIEETIKKMIKQSGKDMALLGSGTILSQFAQQRLIDEYRIMVNPVDLGNGKPLFRGIKNSLNLKLTKARTFGNGNVLH